MIARGQKTLYTHTALHSAHALACTVPPSSQTPSAEGHRGTHKTTSLDRNKTQPMLATLDVLDRVFESYLASPANLCVLCEPLQLLPAQQLKRAVCGVGECHGEALDGHLFEVGACFLLLGSIAHHGPPYCGEQIWGGGVDDMLSIT